MDDPYDFDFSSFLQREYADTKRPKQSDEDQDNSEDDSVDYSYEAENVGREGDDDDRAEPSRRTKEGLRGIEKVQRDKLEPIDKALLIFTDSLLHIGGILNISGKITEEFTLRAQNNMRMLKNFMNHNPDLLALAIIYGLLYANNINKENVTQFIDKVKGKFKDQYLPADIIRYIKIISNQQV